MLEVGHWFVLPTSARVFGLSFGSYLDLSLQPGSIDK